MPRSVQTNGKEIRRLREQKGWSREEMIGVMKPFFKEEKGSVKESTLLKAEANEHVLPSTVKIIARALNVPPESLIQPQAAKEESNRTGTPRADPGRSTTSARATDGHAPEEPQVFGFGERDGKAFPALLEWQKRNRATTARVICFTLHTLDRIVLDLLNPHVGGIEKVELFMGTKQMARRLETPRQQDLLDEGWKKEHADFRRHFGAGRVSIRYYDCPPSITGIALGDPESSAYLINHYLWFPTLNWLAEHNQSKFDEFWASRNVPHRPWKDDYTMNGVDVSSVLVARDHGEPAGGAFSAFADQFELLWATYELDLEGPPVKDLGRPASEVDPFEEMAEVEKKWRS